MKKICFVFVLCCNYLLAFSQGGVNLNVGLVKSEIANPLFNPEGTALYGYQIGADIRLNEGSMYFNPGLHYIRLSVEPQESLDFFGHKENFDIIKGRFGLGFRLIKLSDKTLLRAKLIAAINYITKTHKKFKELYPGYDINEAFAGLDFGVGLDFYALTLDLEYELGVVNMINEVKDTKMNMWRLSLGVFF
jgi:hypothetical protein